ncbi:MAG TPA: VWA domain-containing protein [Pyrinomonadaceae bacterium]|nr:VWA domain-containing protein [Pyrinomonadaceae bacterium]
MVRSVWLSRTVSLLLGTLLTLSSQYSFAQELTSDDDVLRVSTDLAVFPIRAKDGKGRAALNLTVRDFLLKDKDKVTAGLYFAAGAERVALMFALDQSGSLREIISEQRDAAIALLGRFDKNSRVAVLRFSELPSLVVPFDNDPEQARGAFTFPARANARTAIFDAAAAALTAFDSLPMDRAERRIVILISDGLDNASRIKPDRVVQAAQSKGISFYTIQIPLFFPRNGRLAPRPAAKGFRELAEKTGGRYFLIGEKAALETERRPDLSPVFQAIEEDLKSQFLIGFYAADKARDGSAHVVSISLIPLGLSYSVGQYGFARSHRFSLRFARRAEASHNNQ